MAHDHDHDHEMPVDPGVRRLLRIAVVAVAALTMLGLAVWWPDDGATLPQSFAGQGTRVNATVTGIDAVDCAGPEFGSTLACEEIRFDLTSGPSEGSTGTFQLFPETELASPEFEPGDRIVVIEYQLGDTGETAHTFADFQRGTPLVLLAVLFVAAVIALGRFQGVRALAGLGVSALVLFGYVFPALLDGQPPLAVALVSASVIAFAALYLAHGVNDTTTVALLGTLSALALTGLLAAVFTSAAQITGLASEDQIFLLVSAEGIDLRGLVLAGIVLGSLGVLDDVTVTQVSAVARLREANPAYTAADLYRTGVRIGRDHIASTVNTLVLAYAGAALPLLLFYSNIGIGLSESITSEIIATEIIRTLVGSIGLVAAVPLTTGLAAVVVTGGTLPGGRGPRRSTRPPARAMDEPPEAEPPRQPQQPPDDVSWDDFAPRSEEF